MLCPKCGSVLADNEERCAVCQTRLIYPLLKGGVTRPYTARKKPRRQEMPKRRAPFRLNVMLPFVSYLSKPILVFLIVIGIFLFFTLLSGRY